MKRVVCKNGTSKPKSRSVIFPSTYPYPQILHTRAGTLLKTKVAPSFSRVIVFFP